jgi:hypothetical protein
MFKDYLIIDNIFDNPREYIEFSNKINFSENSKPDSWKGKRSSALHEINSKLFYKTFDSIFSKLLSDIKFKSFNYTANAFLHYLTKEVEFNSSWWHQDECIFAGVVYLNEHPEKNSGTLIYVDGKVIPIENVFNRLVFYKSTINHCAEKSFGSSLVDARLTLTFFINNISIEY